MNAVYHIANMCNMQKKLDKRMIYSALHLIPVDYRVCRVCDYRYMSAGVRAKVSMTAINRKADTRIQIVKVLRTQDTPRTPQEIIYLMEKDGSTETNNYISEQLTYLSTWSKDVRKVGRKFEAS